MAQIIISGNVDNIARINRYSSIDTNLVESSRISSEFDLAKDYIEYHVLDGITDALLDSNYNYTEYKIPSDSTLNPNGTYPFVEIDPVANIKKSFFTGEFKAIYNVFRNKITSGKNDFFLKEISDDRTEIRIASTTLTNDQVLAGGKALIDEINASTYSKNFLINFSNNVISVAVNVATDTIGENYSILFKLYEPLPEGITLKTNLWVVEEMTEPYVFTVNLSSSLTVDPLPSLRGPNFSIKIPNQNNVSTKYESYSTVYTSLSGSSYNQISNYLSNNSVDINIDYSDYNEFVRFGSAKKRLENFYNKVKTIEDYKTNIQVINATSSSIKSSEITFYSSSIADIVTGFDGYEQYMYFESSSITYPKTTSTLPYIQKPTASVVTWYNNAIALATNFDTENLDNLEYTIPGYIRENADNAPYLDYVHMIGHYFDNIWIYLKSITELYQSNNNLEQGVSKDLVYYALKSLGVKLYNNNGDASLDNFYVGANSGSLSNLDNIPKKDLLAETYKRIYHNIPLLFKSKGTSKGLNQLINIFGITDDILDIQEYGGNRKNNTLLGSNKEKVRVVSTQITGSILSPSISLEEDSATINNTRSVDYHEVDVSFSPQRKIDNVLSSSIAGVITNFEIDSYIGDPRLETSSSYAPLETLRKSHINSNFTKEFDYAGFIELVKFFDNSLFKMLKDYIPARANVSTGITIRPQHLERIKIKRFQPNITKQNVYEAKFNGPTITEDNDYLYNALSGSKVAFYNGELKGSWPSINDDFIRTNPNPYLAFTTSSLNEFNHTDFNVTLNNSKTSVPSIKVTKLIPLYSYVSGSITQTGNLQVQSDVQDSNEELKSFELSRHAGVKVTSANYNIHADGDDSYGRTAAIDHQVKKLGLISEIVKSKFLPNRNDVVTKYLVDMDGNLTELNQRNKNWEEVQRTFITADNLSVSLFDNQKYSNQKSLDGTKYIFESGYSYTPLVYFDAVDSNLYFQAGNGNVARELEAANSIGTITGSSGAFDFPLVNSGSVRIVNSIFNIITRNVNSSNYLTGSSASFPTYSVPETGLYNITASINMNVTMSLGGSVTWSLAVMDGTSTISVVDQPVYIINSVVGTSVGNISIYKEGSTYYDYNAIPNQQVTPVDTINLDFNILNSSGGVIFASGSTIYKYDVYTTAPSYSQPVANCYSCNYMPSNPKTFWCTSPSINFNVYPISCYTTTYDFNGQQIITYCNPSNNNSNTYGDGSGYVLRYYTFGLNAYEIPDIYARPQNQALSFNIATQQSLTAGHNISFKLIQQNLAPNASSVYSANFSTSGSLRIVSVSNQLNNLPKAIPGGTGFIESTTFNSGSVTSSITLNSQLSSFKGYTFVPNPPSGSGATPANLYTTYGDVDYNFDPGFYDMIVHHNTSGQVSEYRIVNTRTVGSNLVLDIYPAFNNATGSLEFRDPTKYTKILFLKRLKDETNTIITFIKRDGKTSYGFIIPENIHPDVFANIDTISREVKMKLLEAGGLDGGSL